MMYYHTPNTVFEVLLFAIARQIIVDHSSAWSSLIGRLRHCCAFRHKEVFVLRL